MSVHIRSEDEMRDEARAYTLTREVVRGTEMAHDLKIGWKFADAFLAEFQAEGLISQPDKSYWHNVRSPDGDLVEPDSKPPFMWETAAIKLFKGIARLRGRDV